MKKLLISLLLISLITMVGVFADDPVSPTAKLNLETTIAADTEIGISNSETETATYGKNLSVLVKDLFDENGLGIEEIIVAYLHYHSNDTAGMKVKMTGTDLVNQNGSVTVNNKIPYTLSANDTTISTDGKDGSVVTDVIYTKAANTGLIAETNAITLTIHGNDTDYATGSYEGAITFTIEAL